MKSTCLILLYNTKFEQYSFVKIKNKRITSNHAHSAELSTIIAIEIKSFSKNLFKNLEAKSFEKELKPITLSMFIEKNFSIETYNLVDVH
jgi:hypothetical protein